MNEYVNKREKLIQSLQDNTNITKYNYLDIVLSYAKSLANVEFLEEFVNLAEKDILIKSPNYLNILATSLKNVDSKFLYLYNLLVSNKYLIKSQFYKSVIKQFLSIKNYCLAKIFVIIVTNKDILKNKNVFEYLIKKIFELDEYTNIEIIIDIITDKKFINFNNFKELFELLINCDSIEYLNNFVLLFNNDKIGKFKSFQNIITKVLSSYDNEKLQTLLNIIQNETTKGYKLETIVLSAIDILYGKEDNFIKKLSL